MLKQYYRNTKRFSTVLLREIFNVPRRDIPTEFDSLYVMPKT